MNFINQREKYDCGPTAIVNYAKFAGLPLDEDDLDWLRYALGTEEENQGGELYNVEAMLKALNPKARPFFTQNPSTLITAVRTGFPVIVASVLKIKGESHFHLFMLYFKNNKYYAVNLVTNKPVIEIKEDHIRAMVGMTLEQDIDCYFVLMAE